MMKKRQIEKKYRYLKVSHKCSLEALMSLNIDCVWVKIDKIEGYNRTTVYEKYITKSEHYSDILYELMAESIEEKLINKIIEVIAKWYMEKKFFFDNGIYRVNHSGLKKILQHGNSRKNGSHVHWK